MNRTQRAVKKQLRQTMNQKKAEKRRAICEMKDSYLKQNMVHDTLKNEKELKAWHRQIINDYGRAYSNKEALTA